MYLLRKRLRKITERGLNMQIIVLAFLGAGVLFICLSCFACIVVSGNCSREEERSASHKGGIWTKR